MSARGRHDGMGIGAGFLGHLAARVQPRATHAPLSTLERRRPGLFEPRTRPSGTSLDIVDMVDTVAGPVAPSHPQQAVPAASPGISEMRMHAVSVTSALSPTPASLRHSTQSTPTQQFSALPPINVPAGQVLSSMKPAVIQAETSIPAVGSARHHLIAEVRTNRRVGSSATQQPEARGPTAPHAAVAAPQLIAARSVEKTRVERSLLESKTTVIERAIVKQRDTPAPASAASPVRRPPRIVRSEATPAPVAHPARSAAMLATPTTPTPAPVQVSIGRVEIRGFASAAKPDTSRSTPPTPKLGLEQYLQQRHGSGR